MASKNTDFDLNTLVPEDVAGLPKRPSRAANGPVYGWVEDSWNNNVAKSVLVPTEDAAKGVERLARSAAKLLDCGLAVVIAPEEDQYRVSFQAKQKRGYVKAD